MTAGLWAVLAQAPPPAAPPAAPPTSDQLLGFVLLDIVIILVVARLMGSLAKKVGQPAVVGEIIAGILLGPTLLGTTFAKLDSPPEFLHCQQFLAASTPAGQAVPAPSVTACLFPNQAQSIIGLLGQIALILFMFLVGLELDFTRLKGKGKGISLVTIGAVAVPIALAFVVGPYLYSVGGLTGTANGGSPNQLGFTLFIAAMLVVTAFPVMARILQEKHLTTSAMGAIGVAAAAGVTVLMFLTVGLATGVSSDDSTSNIVLRFVFAAVYLAGMFLVVRPALAPLGVRYERRGSLSPPMFAVIVIVFFASAFVANLIGINVIVGGFVAGAVLPAREGLFKDMSMRLADITAVVLLPLFLAFSGLRTDFTKLGVDNIVPLAIFIVVGIAGKWAGSAVFARLGGLSWKEGNVLGILMNCRGLLVLVVGLIAFNLKVISAPMQVGGVLMALVTTMMTGPLFDVFSKKLPQAGTPPIDLATAEVDTFRVLVGVTSLVDAPEVTQTVLASVGDRRPAEVVLCRPYPLPHRETGLAGSGDSTGEADRSLRALRILRGFAPPDIEVTPVAFGSSDPAADLRRVATERGCDVLVQSWHDIEITRHLPTQGDYRVIRYRLPSLSGDGEQRTGPVLLIGASDDDDLAVRLAAGLAQAGGVTVERAGPGATVPAGTRAVVLVASDAADLDRAEDLSCAVYAFEPAVSLAPA